MRSDQLCSNCEWWDDRGFPDDVHAYPVKYPCLRWPGGELRTGGDQRCWQWAAKVVDPGPGEPDQDLNPDLEKVVGLVREAGLSTGHADNCTDLVRELLGDITEQRRVAEDWAKQATELKMRWDRARRLLYQVCMEGPMVPEVWDQEVRQLLREGLLRAESNG